MMPRIYIRKYHGLSKKKSGFFFFFFFFLYIIYIYIICVCTVKTFKYVEGGPDHKAPEVV